MQIIVHLLNHISMLLNCVKVKIFQAIEIFQFIQKNVVFMFLLLVSM